jgi:hypothetical protein
VGWFDIRRSKNGIVIVILKVFFVNFFCGQNQNNSITVVVSTSTTTTDGTGNEGVFQVAVTYGAQSWEVSFHQKIILIIVLIHGLTFFR